jgi:hypothetical protein
MARNADCLGDGVTEKRKERWKRSTSHDGQNQEQENEEMEDEVTPKRRGIEYRDG